MRDRVATVLIKDDRPYFSAFANGLSAAGYEVHKERQVDPIPGDVLLLWNRLPTQDHIARLYERIGATVLIAENGWIGENTYTLCQSYHCGAGYWFVGEESRWPKFGIQVQPWRKSGEHILVIPQRGMGIPPIAMPRTWTADTIKILENETDRPIRIREPRHRLTPLEPDFDDCHAVVTWASGAGIKAIVAGIPVFYKMPGWVGQYAAVYGIEPDFYGVGDLEKPYLGQREMMLHVMSWAMWQLDEIETGEPFKCVLR